jgi:hypothetical protein
LEGKGGVVNINWSQPKERERERERDVELVGNREGSRGNYKVVKAAIIRRTKD